MSSVNRAASANVPPISNKMIVSLTTKKTMIIFALAATVFLVLRYVRSKKRINAVHLQPQPQPGPQTNSTQLGQIPTFPAPRQPLAGVPQNEFPQNTLEDLAKTKKCLIIRNLLSQKPIYDPIWKELLQQSNINAFYSGSKDVSLIIGVNRIYERAVNYLTIVMNHDGKWVNTVVDGDVALKDKFWVTAIESVFCKIIGKYSSYNHIMNTRDQLRPRPQLSIQILRESLMQYPRWHLGQFARSLEEEWYRCLMPDMTVTFLKEDDLQPERYIDVGGLSRDYLNDIITGLIKHSHLFFQFDSSPLVMPESNENITQTKTNSYLNLGFVLMYCYLSSSIPKSQPRLIGRHFDDALFLILRALTAEDIEKEISLKRKLELARVFISAYAGTPHNIDYMKQWLDLLAKDNPSDKELEQAIVIADVTDFCKSFKDQRDQCDKNMIKANPKGFMESFADTVLLQRGDHGILANQIEAIRSIASGMKRCLRVWMCATQRVGSENAYWDNIITTSTDINSMIQGSTDKKKIAQSIDIHKDSQNDVEIQKKTAWLKEWIEKEATEEELRNFLIFVGGSPGLPSGKRITVMAQKENPNSIPRAQSCFYTLKISGKNGKPILDYNDKNKSGFIKALKYALINPSSYQVG